MATPPPTTLRQASSLGPDPEFAEIYEALSTPVDEAGVSRRRFLQGALATGGAGFLTGGPLARLAAAALPLTTADPILVVILLGGGNDGLNTVIPVGDANYRRLRPSLSSAATGAHRLGTSGLSLHPALPKLAQRYAAGKVAVVRGVGNPALDHSHFSSMATWMAGTAGTARTSGWLGRYLDGLDDSPSGLRGVALDASVPLHLLGTRAEITALQGTSSPFGSARGNAAETALFKAIRAYGARSSGLGRWGDEVGAQDRAAIDLAREYAPLFGSGVTLPPGRLTGQLDTAARLINLNLGAKVIGATFGSFDTHDTQLYWHRELLTDLDNAIAAFYARLDPKWASQVVFLTFSEFGRRAAENGSGTDHGTSGPMFVIGDRVRGGLYGRQPSLSGLDSRGDLAVHVDFRSVYASVLGGWLGVDPKPILGGDYPDLGLFTSRPGGPPPPPPPPPPDTRFLPFATATKLVEQQYQDFLGRVGTPTWVTTWTTRLTSATWTVPQALEEFYRGSDLYRYGIDASRLAILGTRAPARYDVLNRWAASVKAGGSLRAVAVEVVATSAWRARYGSLTGSALTDRVHRDIIGIAAPATWIRDWNTRYAAGAKPADMFLATAMSNTAKARYRNLALVPTVYACMLRRAPDASNNATWATRLTKGMTLRALLGEFFKTAEYGRRFQ